jgi:hypothetical protein
LDLEEKKKISSQKRVAEKLILWISAPKECIGN